MIVIIDSVVLFEINYSYELESVKLQKLGSNNSINNVLGFSKSNGFTQYHILMGYTKESQINIIKSVYISSSHKDKVVLPDSIRQKVELLQIVRNYNEDIRPLALLIINPNVGCDSQFIDIILNEFQINYKFEYEPTSGDSANTLHEYIDNELQLKCYYWDQKWYLTDFEIKNGNIDLTPASLDMEAQGKQILRTNHRYTKFEREINLTDHGTFNEETKEQEEFIKRLIKRIDRMIDYLEQNPSPNEDILIKVNLLIRRLHSVNTDDIDTELTSIENEIETFQTICNQWEIIN